MALQAAQTGRSLRRAVLTFLVPEWSRSFATEGRSTIDFGYREVPLQEKEGLVAGVFSSVAGSYDVMNDLMSAGMHRVWKDSLVAELRPFAGMKHLDVAGGTGDVAFRVLAAVQAAEASGGGAAAAAAAAAAPQPQSRAGHVTVCDINPAMLAVGRRRAAERGLDAGGQLSWVEGNAEALPIPSGSQDAYTVAFGLRNMTDRGAVLREALRVLRRGGRFLCLEFSQVRGAALRELYDAYSFSVIPRIGALVAGDADSYQYLVESIRQFPDQATLAAMIRDAGFKGVTYDNYSNGIVALHSGFKL